jgi:hypothetical protein
MCFTTGYVCSLTLVKNNPTDDSFRRRFTPEQMGANEVLEVKIKFSIEGDEH